MRLSFSLRLLLCLALAAPACGGVLLAGPRVAVAASKGKAASVSKKNAAGDGQGASAKSGLMTEDLPVEVSADQSLEWYQSQRLYVARGNAKAVRGGTVVEADLLSAHAREPDKKEKKNAADQARQKAGDAKDEQTQSGSIDRLMAEGNVCISDPQQKVFGDRAVYDFDRHVATVTGQHLKYQTAKETVTARDSLNYYDDRDVAVAQGKASAVRADGQRIDGDVLTASFVQDGTGQKVLSSLTAEGNVVVYNGQDVACGEHAIYDPKADRAMLSGHVRITREGMQLSGDKAEVDFKNGESRLLNEGSGRVRALIPARAVNSSSKASSHASKKGTSPSSSSSQGGL